MEALQITSTQNPRIKSLVALQQKASERRRQGLFVVEGRREIDHCIESGFEIKEIYYSPTSALSLMEGNINGATIIEVSKQVYEKIAYRGSTEGVVAVVKEKNLELADLTLPENPLVVVVESVEKPGNLGAILRSADAAGVNAVIVCDPLTDLYNPNLIRSSIGARFTVQCVACSSDECIEFLKARNIQI
ncbi:MAG: RNA methyltransferase, partial [Bacteroidaceae bacterium]|nr:RNA methyltransferase [Bacteroidaceae bacterium]